MDDQRDQCGKLSRVQELSNFCWILLGGRDTCGEERTEAWIPAEVPELSQKDAVINDIRVLIIGSKVVSLIFIVVIVRRAGASALCSTFPGRGRCCHDVGIDRGCEQGRTAPMYDLPSLKECLARG